MLVAASTPRAHNAQPLLGPVGMVMLDAFLPQIVEVLRPANNKVIRAFQLDRLNESLDTSVHVRRLASTAESHSRP